MVPIDILLNYLCIFGLYLLLHLLRAVYRLSSRILYTRYLFATLLYQFYVVSVLSQFPVCEHYMILFQVTYRSISLSFQIVNILLAWVIDLKSILFFEDKALACGFSPEQENDLI